MKNLFQDPVLLAKVFKDINSKDSIILRNCQEDNSYVKLDEIYKNNKGKRLIFKRIPVIKTSKKLKRFIWLSRDINKEMRKVKYVKKINNSKIVISKKNNLLLSKSDYWDTYIITNTIKFVDLKDCYINGIVLHYKFNRIIKLDSIRVCQGYFRINDKKVVAVTILSIFKEQKNPVIIKINNNIYIIKDSVVYRISTEMFEELLDRYFNNDFL